MHRRKPAAILILGIICFLLASVSTALGEPDPQVVRSREDDVTPLSDNAALSKDNRQQSGDAKAAKAKSKETAYAANPQPTPPIDLTNADVQKLKEEHPSLISRIVSTTSNLVTRAYSWLGTRYSWGGTSSRGVDCSGLTQLLMRAEGIHIPRTARQQFQQGQPVAKNSLLPGDLVFFNTRGPITHVGMYIGNRQFIHAANPRRGVRVDSVDSAYYANRYAGARRYKNLNQLALGG